MILEVLLVHESLVSTSLTLTLTPNVEACFQGKALNVPKSSALRNSIWGEVFHNIHLTMAGVTLTQVTFTGLVSLDVLNLSLRNHFNLRDSQ